ncbi:MAG: inorganic phosphate transporter [Acidobacteria bacterium]|nr:inorganic phosphate transporter [Acidobacteriota bacterium]
MGLEWLFAAVIILIAFAVFDLMVGVSNDAVNFLNSAVGSRVAPRYIIMIIASIGIMVGVSFSSGMMEVARKGIFHPEFFTMPELLTIFLGVMITDIILLDLFNTYGLPTSTTVSIVFELLGGAVAVSILKIVQQEGSLLGLYQYINTGKAMVIIFGILLSVVVAFSLGAVVQFLTRLLFTFDYARRLKRYGAVWGGMAYAFIAYFILIKGAKGAFFISSETAAAIKDNAFLIMIVIFVISSVFLQILLFFKVNVLKPVVLVGTFALAMAFAANDLVNFIGVPVAGYQAYGIASATDAPLTTLMGAMGAKVPTPSVMIIIAGLIMVVTLWLSKKARTVTDTEISLGEQLEEEEKFESIFLSRAIVGIAIRFVHFLRALIPLFVQHWLKGRLDTSHYKAELSGNKKPSFDLLRASVNMMVAAAVISYATSQTLPLSTTYVTFMVAMGTSLSDLAWGRESAVYRIAGVFTVIGGWFLTALSAFVVSGLIATIIFYTERWGVLGLLGVTAYIIWQNHRIHKERAKQKDIGAVFNLKKITDAEESISITFEHMAVLLGEIRGSLSATLTALYNQNEYVLKNESKKVNKIQKWSDTIIANVFKCMRLLSREETHAYLKYPQTIRRIQKLSDGHRDIVQRAYLHVRNHHKGLLDIQKQELETVGKILDDMLLDVEKAFKSKDMMKYKDVQQRDIELRNIAERLNKLQMERIRGRESKTRLSILFYAIVGNAMMLSKQNLKLIEIFAETFGDLETKAGFDAD